MTYRIKFYYSTGDSFGSRDTSAELECVFQNLDIAKENLQRIKAHEIYYRSLQSSYIKAKKKPKCWVENKGDPTSGSIRLKADNGNEFIIYPFWQGYFERLISAEVIINQDELKITF